MSRPFNSPLQRMIYQAVEVRPMDRVALRDQIGEEASAAGLTQSVNAMLARGMIREVDGTLHAVPLPERVRRYTPRERRKWGTRAEIAQSWDTVARLRREAGDIEGAARARRAAATVRWTVRKIGS